MPRLPTHFISHGGGPWPWIPNMRQMLATLVYHDTNVFGGVKASSYRIG